MMKRAIGAIVAIVSTTGFAVASMGGAASAAVQCSNETYGQSAVFLYLANGSPASATGLSVPAPAAGETLTVVSSSWTTYDYLPFDTSPSRADQNQQNERFGLAVGGVAIGGLSADLPDTVAQGAVDDWSSGIHSGSFGGAAADVAGGAITLRHASLSGFTESDNSFIVKSFSLTVQRCVTTVDSTTTTAAETTTTTTAATTTTAVGATTTTAAATTTSVASGGPTTTTAAAAPATTTTVAVAALPTTGTNMTLPLVLAALAGLTGTALLVVRRRPS
jgi:LPXTG-motif cell wall-anchored protein